MHLDDKQWTSITCFNVKIFHEVHNPKSLWRGILHTNFKIFPLVITMLHFAMCVQTVFKCILENSLYYQDFVYSPTSHTFARIVKGMDFNYQLDCIAISE